MSDRASHSTSRKGFSRGGQSSGPRRSKGSDRTQKGRQDAASINEELTQRVITRLAERFSSVPSRSLPSSTGPVTLASQPGTLEQVGREADLAWNGVKRIMSLLNVEEKQGVSGGTTNVSYNGYGVDLTSGIAQGVSGTQRIGDSLKIKQVCVQGLVGSNGAGSSYTAVLGMSRDGYPSLADIFSLVGVVRAGMNYPLVNTEGADHWVVFKRHYISSSHLVDKFELKHTFSHDVKYLAGTTTVSSGCVWFAVITDTNASNPQLDWTASIQFVDN